MQALDLRQRLRGALPQFASFLIAACAGTASALPTFDEVRADFRPSDTLILSREGEVLQRLRTDATVRRGQWVPLADVSPALRTALVDVRVIDHLIVAGPAVLSFAERGLL